MNRILVFTFVLSSLVAFAQPDWVNPIVRSSTYTSDSYLTGFISEQNTSKQAQDVLLQKLVGLAKAQLSDNISVQVNSISTLNVHNVNAATHEEFQKLSVSYSSATIAGLETETFYDTKKEIGYAFVYAKIADVVTYYQNSIKTKLDRVKSLEQTATTAASNESKLKTLLEAQTLTKDIENDQVMIVTLTGKYDDPSLYRADVRSLRSRVESAIATISSNEHTSLDDGSYYIAYTLSTQLDKKKPLIITNFTYQDTPMSSEFSRKLNTMLERKLVQQGFRVTNQASDSDIVLKGTYWEEGDKMRISALVREQSSGAAIGSVDTWLSLAAMSGTSFKPENYQQALVNMKEFAANEVKGGDLMLDLYTNKGKDNLIFTEGETLKLFVRANRECYLRFIYHLADGSKVLLLDNYYINRDNVNQTYELPYEFECAEPFGVETLQLNAQSERFEPLNTKEEYGYNFIVDSSQEIIVNTRGFKNKTDTSLKAEKRLVFTTMSQ